MLIDSHVNLHAPQFDPDRESVIERAREAGVGMMIEICDRIGNFPAVHALALGHANIWATVGTHPHEAKENPGLEVASLCDLAQAAKVVGIGETGLDFHYDLSPRAVQVAIFRVHIEAAQRTGLPLVVHSREADAVMAEILEEEHRASPFPILMHCYTSGAELAARAAALGAWFSVSGIATFKPAEAVRPTVTGVNHFPVVTALDIEGEDGFAILAGILEEAGGLEALAPHPGRPQGETFSRLDFAQRHALKLAAWPKDVLRHTAASYLLALHGDVGKVAMMLGNSPNILLTHYHEPVCETDCAAFWKTLQDSI